MKLERIVVAVDNSDAGRGAARSAAHMAERSGAELILLSVAPGVNEAAGVVVTPLDRLEASLGPDFFDEFAAMPLEAAGVYGLPQVEIGRYAEYRHADLIVLGRKPRSRTARLFLGDTADAVLRRSRIPCLAVPPDLAELAKMTVALDGTDRGFMVYEYAAGFADACCMQLSAVTVEPRWAGEPAALTSQVWSARSERLADMIGNRSRRGRKGNLQGGGVAVASGLHVRHGPVVEEIIHEVAATDSDVLALGFHRGGPPLVVSNTSVSRTLVHSAPCAVLTVPF